MCATVWKSLLRSYCPAIAHSAMHGDALLKSGCHYNYMKRMMFLLHYLFYLYRKTRPTNQLIPRLLLILLQLLKRPTVFLGYLLLVCLQRLTKGLVHIPSSAYLFSVNVFYIKTSICISVNNMFLYLIGPPCW